VPPAQSIPDVIARMRALEEGLPAHDGVAWFTRLYLAVTENVAAVLKPRAFKNPAFLERLDVVFANLFFSALERTPRAWAPLIACRERRGVAPIQFALCGMNAHINRDLPVALVQTAQALGVDLARARGVHSDFTAINRVLEQTEARVKSEFATGIVGLADEALGALDDRIAMWDVGRAREAAWVQGQVLWQLRGVPALSRRYVDTLDRTVGFAGRGLLVPLPTR
jgi:hypothetical protein